MLLSCYSQATEHERRVDIVCRGEGRGGSGFSHSRQRLEDGLSPTLPLRLPRRLPLRLPPCPPFRLPLSPESLPPCQRHHGRCQDHWCNEASSMIDSTSPFASTLYRSIKRETHLIRSTPCLSTATRVSLHFHRCLISSTLLPIQKFPRLHPEISRPQSQANMVVSAGMVCRLPLAHVWNCLVCR